MDGKGLDKAMKKKKDYMEQLILETIKKHQKKKDITFTPEQMQGARELIITEILIPNLEGIDLMIAEGLLK